MGRDAECKPFKKTHAEQIKLVSDWSWFDSDALKGTGGEYAEILSKSEYIDAERGAAITAAITKRCEQIEKISQEKLSTLDAIREHQALAPKHRGKSGKKRESER